MENIETAKVAESSSFLGSIWKKVLLYPTMFTAVLGAIPTGLDLYKAQKYQVGFKDVAQAEEQAKLWQKNFMCVSNMQFHAVQTQNAVGVEVGACDSGDVMIKVSQPQKPTIARWVSLEQVQEASLVSLVSRAYASPLPTKDGSFRVAQAGNTNICTKWTKPGQEVLQVVKKADGKCYQELTNVLKSKILDSKEVPCDSTCN